MLKPIRTQPLFLWLLPVFFVVHGVLENFGFIPFGDAALLCASYLLASAVLAGLFYLLFRSFLKAALMAALCMGIFFGFGAIQDFIYTHWEKSVLGKYSVLLSGIGTILIIAAWNLKKRKAGVSKLVAFLNVLLLVYLIVDAVSIVVRAGNEKNPNLSVFAAGRPTNFTPCDTCSKPAIYFLVFDEYASSSSLKERFGFENDLDSFLLQKGFSIAVNSQSNYNFTPFSMASILNMDYLKGIPDVNAITVRDYARCNELIRNNQAIMCLNLQGYGILNYSIFDLAGHPSQVNQSFLPLKTRLITSSTLFSRVNRDIGWLLVRYFPFSLFVEKDILRDRNNNNRFIDLTQQAAYRKRERPFFLYAHFYMPHVPYYYTEAGAERNTDTLFAEAQTISSPSTYLAYVRYTNTRIREMVETIRQNDPGSVIIIMGDHGFRSHVKESAHLFTNFNAVYLGPEVRDSLPNRISGVNQFRIIFNKLFHQSLPLLKDSSILLKDQTGGEASD